ncbi:MAG: DinB family protein [Thermoanaerobaculia bacterium]
MDAALVQLVALFEEAFERKSWHGTTLKGSLRGLSAPDASRRPGPGRHNIWEVALHAAYWKYVARRRITGDRRLSFPRTGSNWFVCPPEGIADDRLWREDIALLQEEHRKLRNVLTVPGARFVETQLRVMRGVIAHDLYHAGQIQLLKRLAQETEEE